MISDFDYVSTQLVAVIMAVIAIAIARFFNLSNKPTVIEAVSSSHTIDEDSDPGDTRKRRLRHTSWRIPESVDSAEQADSLQRFVPKTVLEVLQKYDVDLVRGFLPIKDPIHRLPSPRYRLWEDLGDDLPKLLGARLGQARGPLKDIPVLDIDELRTVEELRRAHLLLSLFAHAYIWGGPEPLDEIPEGIALPLWQVSERLGLPPVLGHPSIILYNWRRLDPHGEICMENLATLNNFFDGRDESWFYLITLEVEARGAAAVAPIMLATEAIQKHYGSYPRSFERPAVAQKITSQKGFPIAARNTDLEESNRDSAVARESDHRSHIPRPRALSTGAYESKIRRIASGAELDNALKVVQFVCAQLDAVALAVDGMCDSLESMREGCHPFIFYHRVRPFLSGWKDNPILPRGVEYKGVTDATTGQSQRLSFFGGSAAQSALIPFLDIGLGISHKKSRSHSFLFAMRDYMIKPHREFLKHIESISCIREFIIQYTGVFDKEKVAASIDEKPGVLAELPSSISNVPGLSFLRFVGLDNSDNCNRKILSQLVSSYNSCVKNIERFRSGHINLVAEYIIAQQIKKKAVSESAKGDAGGSDKPVQHSIEANAGGKGTGGTELMKFLKPVRDNCTQAILPEFVAAESTGGEGRETDTTVIVEATVYPGASESPVTVPAPPASAATTTASVVLLPSRTAVSRSAEAGQGDGNCRVEIAPQVSALSDTAVESRREERDNSPYRKDNAGLEDIDLYRGAVAPRRKSIRSSNKQDVANIFGSQLITGI